MPTWVRRAASAERSVQPAQSSSVRARPARRCAHAVRQPLHAARCADRGCHTACALGTRRARARTSDCGKCSVPWCRSSRNVDQHHLIPISQGGQHTLENIISLCESHHIAHHAGALCIEGTASNATFTRRAHNSFAITERAVETSRALKDLGFDKREVKAAMERTRTHVGTSELSLQQWIKIALSYCPRPTM
jgi:hypothetical protein